MEQVANFQDAYLDILATERDRLLDLVRAMLCTTSEGVVHTILCAAETSLEVGDIRRGREFLDRLFPPGGAGAVQSAPNCFRHSAGRGAAR